MLSMVIGQAAINNAEGKNTSQKPKTHAKQYEAHIITEARRTLQTRE